MKSTFNLLVIATGFAVLSGCGNEPQKPAPGTTSNEEMTEASTGNANKGKSQYLTCATCHGQQGEGMKTLNAPALAGQEAYYLRQQLNNFRTNKRGTHPDDPYGAQMGPFAKTLNSESIEDVIAYIQTMPEPTLEQTIEGGDAAKGEAYYNMICGACHGAGAKGIESLNSPRLTGLQDWYIERQLHNFKDSIRGIHPEDKFGAQMQQIAVDIPDEETISDLVAYLNSLHSE
jgi:cytochrome c oxidase subunit 2